MDLSQVYLLALNALFIVWVVNVSLNKWVLNQPILDSFMIVYATTVVLSSPTWLVKLWLENKSWFRRNPTGVVDTPISGEVIIPPPDNVDPIVDDAPVPPSTDVSEVNHAGVLPVVAPTQFPLPEPTADASNPTNKAWVG